MKILLRLYDQVIAALAALSGAALAFVFISIIYDVVTRTIGLIPPTWVIATTEYALLYVTALSAPWLLRRKGHVCIEIVRTYMPAHINHLMAKTVYFLGMSVSLILVVFSIPVIEASWHEYDIRAYELPRWLLYAPLTVGFFFLAIGFARYLFGNESMYGERETSEDGL